MHLYAINDNGEITETGPSHEERALLSGVFFNHKRARLQKALLAGLSVAHYTGSNNLLKILGAQSLSLRNVRRMSDKTEISHGRKVLQQALQTRSSARMFGELSMLGSDFTAETAYGLYFRKSHYCRTLSHTFVHSLAEHSTAPDGRDGDPKMWKEFGTSGGGVPTAIIWRTSGTPFFEEAESACVYPVEYVDLSTGESTNWIVEELDAIADGVEKNREALLVMDKDWIMGHLMQTMRLAVVTTKRPCFAFEREWRLVRTQGWRDNVPGGQPRADWNGNVNGLVDVRLLDHSATNPDMADLSLNNIIAEILVQKFGASDAIRLQIIEALQALGVSDAHDKVRIVNLQLPRRDLADTVRPLT